MIPGTSPGPTRTSCGSTTRWGKIIIVKTTLSIVETGNEDVAGLKKAQKHADDFMDELQALKKKLVAIQTFMDSNKE